MKIHILNNNQTEKIVINKKNKRLGKTALLQWRGAKDRKGRKIVMRSIKDLFLCAALLFISCKEMPVQPEQITKRYDHLLFERTGGGSLVFQLSMSTNNENILINIDKMAFRDTSIQIEMKKCLSISGVCDTLVQALMGKISVEGTYKQDSLPTGTWVHLYLLHDEQQIEVTNVILRSTLLKFEPIVRLEYYQSGSTCVLPGWIREVIAGTQNIMAGNPPEAVLQCQYKGATVYYFASPCCDMFNVLYDSNGCAICAPDGGFTGRGDGHCSDFFQEAKQWVIVWKR